MFQALNIDKKANRKKHKRGKKENSHVTNAFKIIKERASSAMVLSFFVAGKDDICEIIWQIFQGLILLLLFFCLYSELFWKYVTKWQNFLLNARNFLANKFNKTIKDARQSGRQCVLLKLFPDRHMLKDIN